MSILNSSVIAIMLVVTNYGYLNVSGKDAQIVPLSDFSTSPILRLKWPEIMLTIPPSNVASVGSVVPKVKIEGTNLIVRAKYVFGDKPATTSFNLPELGIKKEMLINLNVFWENPDGVRHPLKVETADDKAGIGSDLHKRQMK